MIPMRPLERKSALRYGVYYAARLLPHPLLRGGVGAAIRAWVNSRQGRATASRGIDAQAALTRLSEAGLALMGGMLSPPQVDDVVSYLAKAPVAQSASSAVYDLPTIMACPHLLGLMNHPGLLQIATGFLGCKPTISGVGLRWSFPHATIPSDVQRFHRDTEDWKILRLFVYLTDVFADSGPHQFVAGSHKSAGRFRLQPYTDADIDRQFGRDSVVTLLGPKGTTFFGDMWGVHRGVPPAEHPRLLFSCTYTMTATPIYRYEPVKVPDGHLYDGYTNRLLIAQAGPMSSSWGPMQA
jgi:hypothetical protein